MGKRNRWRDHIDPECQRWGQKYPRFPGVAECARLILARKAKGAWVDIIVQELAENAASCLQDLVDAFLNHPGGDVRLYVMIALDIARSPEAVPFLTEVMREGDSILAGYAESALRGIDTSEARKALWQAGKQKSQ